MCSKINMIEDRMLINSGKSNNLANEENKAKLCIEIFPIETAWGNANWVEVSPTGDISIDNIIQSIEASFETGVGESCSDIGLLIFGRAPIFAYGMILARAINLGYKWIAFYYPQESCFIKVYTRKNESIEEYKLPYVRHQNGKIVGIIGPPHSGKSCIFQAIHSVFLDKDWYFATPGNLDGEGPGWTGHVKATNFESIRKKGIMDENFVAMKIARIENLKKIFRLVIVDLGGKTSKETKAIFSICDYGILVYANNRDISAFRELASEFNKEIIAEIETFQNSEYGIEANFNKEGQILKGKLYNVRRGKDCIESLKKQIIPLANFLIDRIFHANSIS